MMAKCTHARAERHSRQHAAGASSKQTFAAKGKSGKRKLVIRTKDRKVKNGGGKDGRKERTKVGIHAFITDTDP
jgi:hypothetical protein